MDLSKYNAAQQYGWKALSRVATAQFLVFPVAEGALIKHGVPSSLKPHFPTANNLLEVLKQDHSLDFMVMGNFMRLGGELEIFLSQYYANRYGCSWRNLTFPHKKYSGAVFQRTLPNTQMNTVIDLFQTISVDLFKIKYFSSIQEYFVHRHLYVHQTGLVDRKYLDQIEAALGVTERARIENAVLKEAAATKVEDAVVFWFEPLGKRFTTLITEAQEFILDLPV